MSSECEICGAENLPTSDCAACSDSCCGFCESFGLCPACDFASGQFLYEDPDCSEIDE